MKAGDSGKCGIVCVRCDSVIAQLCAYPKKALLDVNHELGGFIRSEIGSMGIEAGSHRFKQIREHESLLLHRIGREDFLFVFLLSFLDALIRAPKLLVIDRLRLSAVAGKEDRLRANLVLQQLLLK